MTGAEVLLHRLQEGGFDLRVDATGGLRVAPAAMLHDELRDEIRQSRDALVALLHDPSDDRRLCGDCTAFDGLHCRRPALSGMEEPGVVSRMPQRCPGFAPLA